MKKFTKITLYTAAGLLIVGCLLGSISAIAGGGSFLRKNNSKQAEAVLDRIGRAVYRATDGRFGYLESSETRTETVQVEKEGTGKEGTGKESNENESTGKESTEKENTGRETASDAGRETGQGDQIASADIREIEMELGAGTFSVTEKDEDDGLIDIYIEEVEGKCTYEVKRGTLRISGFQNIRNGFSSIEGMRENRVEVRVPKGSYFNEIDLDIGACYMEVSHISAGKLEVSLGAAELYLTDTELNELDADVGAGRIEASNVQTVKGDISVGVGECVYSGTISGNLEAECGMGNMEFYLTGSEQDHDYEVECSMGNVEIGSYSTEGFLGSERHINNHAGSKFEIECDMGNVTISFEDQ